MGLDARKPVFWGLRTTKTQTSLRIHWKVSYLNLLQAKFQYSSWSLLLMRLVLVSLCLKPRRSRPNYLQGTHLLSEKSLSKHTLQQLPSRTHDLRPLAGVMGGHKVLLPMILSSTSISYSYKFAVRPYFMILDVGAYFIQM